MDDDEITGQWEMISHLDGHLLLPRLIRYIEERRHGEARFTGAIERHPSPLVVVWGQDDPIAVAVHDRPSPFGPTGYPARTCWRVSVTTPWSKPRAASSTPSSEASGRATRRVTEDGPSGRRTFGSASRSHGAEDLAVDDGEPAAGCLRPPPIGAGEQGEVLPGGDAVGEQLVGQRRLG